MDATERFSNRVQDYARYRPHYPAAVIGSLQTNCQLLETSVIADVGSGTGILTELFLRHGNPVLAVEPNRQMREAGERLLEGYPHFQSIAGRAEATTLPEQSVDFVTAGQAFHWFDRKKAKAEFSRILKARGWVVLAWNERRVARLRSPRPMRISCANTRRITRRSTTGKLPRKSSASSMAFGLGWLASSIVSALTLTV